MKKNQILAFLAALYLIAVSFAIPQDIFIDPWFDTNGLPWEAFTNIQNGITNVIIQQIHLPGSGTATPQPFSTANVSEVCRVIPLGTSENAVVRFLGSTNPLHEREHEFAVSNLYDTLELNDTNLSVVDQLRNGVVLNAEMGTTLVTPLNSNIALTVTQLLNTSQSALNGTNAISSNDMVSVFSISNAAFGMLDLNPMNMDGVKDILSWLRYLFIWGLTMAYVYAVWDCVQEKINFTSIAPQSHASGQGVMGTNMNLATALLAGTIIVGVLITIPTAFHSWFSATNVMNWILLNPLNGHIPGFSDNPIWLKAAIWLVNQCFPVDYFFALGLSYAATRLIMMKMQIWVTAAVRMCTG